MSKISEKGHLCVYGHFSQPPRGNPLTRELGEDPDAAPYVNWNHRIAERCYVPNAEAGNFEYISYSLSESLLFWMQQHEAKAYETIIAADAETHNALATAYHHSILPLARRRDKRTQIIWGITAFEQRFGRKPVGFWLPEMAVDEETLRLLAEAGIEYTILAGQQIRSETLPAGAGPYRVALSGGGSLAVFVRNDALSSEISFNIHNLGGAGFWARNTLGHHRRDNAPLLLLATEGETFGHHYAGEDQFLHWLVAHEAPAIGYGVVTLDNYLSEHPPQHSVDIHMPSSWSDQRGLASWATGQASPGVDTTWKGALRRALDNAASELDRCYEDLCSGLGVDPWALRDRYAPVLFEATSADDFVREQVKDIGPEDAERLKVLLSSQELAQRMYNSYTFTNDRLDSRQPRYAIACAAAALAMAQEATGTDLSERLRSDLAVVISVDGELSGSDLLDHVLNKYDLLLEK